MPKKKCVICEIESGVGALARAYVLGSRQGYREADTPPDKDAAEDAMCATHRRQADEATVKLMVAASRKGAELIRREGKKKRTSFDPGGL